MLGMHERKLIPLSHSSIKSYCNFIFSFASLIVFFFFRFSEFQFVTFDIRWAIRVSIIIISYIIHIPLQRHINYILFFTHISLIEKVWYATKNNSEHGLMISICSHSPNNKPVANRMHNINRL